ncbi:MAG TPA: serine/threonine-protein kinase [Polyangiaceae bacterium]|nr:serine/threonine-protein kinase [Polyangiaceae bacterium]
MPLGAGGMGEVFLVEHTQLGRECVAKILHARLAGDARLVDRMRVEAQSLGRLNHPHIVQITGFGKTRDGRPFLVMEWLRGHTLTAELASFGKLHAKEALRLTCQLLSALAAAHAIGVVHRDIKPDNLFIYQEPDGTRNLKVLDFGVARVLPDAPDSAPNPLAVPTGTGVVVGTPRFVSPEGAMGQRVDGRADLYAAALVLYTMVAGRGPFDHFDGDQSLLSAHALEDPKPPSQFADVPASSLLDGVILKGLAKNPAARYQSALQFKEELERTGDTLFRAVGWVETTSFDLSAIGAPPVATQPLPQEAPIEVTAQLPPSSVEPPALMEAAPPRLVEAPPAQVEAVSDRAVAEAPRYLVGLVFVAAIALAALVAAGLVFLFLRLRGV